MKKGHSTWKDCLHFLGDLLRNTALINIKHKGIVHHSNVNVGVIVDNSTGYIFQILLNLKKLHYRPSLISTYKKNIGGIFSLILRDFVLPTK